MFTITASDGVRIAVYDLNPQSQKVALLIHGWPLSHEIFEYQTELLLENGYRVVSLDLRGFGASDAPAFGYCYDQMAMDVHSVVECLGLRRFTLAGFSMGGAVALRYMRVCRGQGVCRLILLAAAAPIWTQREDYPSGIACGAVNALIDQAATDRPQLAKDFSRQLFACQHSEAAIDWFRGIALSASGVGTIRCGTKTAVLTLPASGCQPPSSMGQRTASSPASLPGYSATALRAHALSRWKTAATASCTMSWTPLTTLFSGRWKGKKQAAGFPAAFAYFFSCTISSKTSGRA